MSNNVMSYNGAISNRDDVVSCREKVRCGSIQMVIERPHQVCKICKLHVSLWNLGRMNGRVSEIVETIGHRGINICCVQEQALLRKAIFLQIGTFCILSGYTKVILSLETIKEV